MLVGATPVGSFAPEMVRPPGPNMRERRQPDRSASFILGLTMTKYLEAGASKSDDFSPRSEGH